MPFLANTSRSVRCWFSAAFLTGVLASTPPLAQTQPEEDRLPDGDIASYRNNGTVVTAWYGSPTNRYRHGVLGDAIEAGSLHVQIGTGPIMSFYLPESEVFEDRTPRIADLNGDGSPEVVTIRSFLSGGGSVAVFGVKNDQLTELAATDPIGRPNRWLNIAGIADFAGHGRQQIAYVETPHIGGTLRFVEWDGPKLVQIAHMAGFSNHKIGAREQQLSAVFDYNNDSLSDLAVPSNGLDRIHVIGFENGTLVQFFQIPLPAAVLKSRAMTPNDDGCIEFELADGQIQKICAKR